SDHARGQSVRDFHGWRRGRWWLGVAGGLAAIDGDSVIFSSMYSGRLDEELHTDSTVLFTKARRKNAINRGIKEFAELTECFVKWSTVVITSTAAEYDLNTAITSTDYIRLAKTPIEFYYTDASSNV